jgi:hypothetical protein
VCACVRVCVCVRVRVWGGVYISANYLLGVATAEDAALTVGTIDLGGGSVQASHRPSTRSWIFLLPSDLRAPSLNLDAPSYPALRARHLPLRPSPPARVLGVSVGDGIVMV